MPPKKKSSNGETNADQEIIREAKRIRALASPSLLQCKPPQPNSQIPASLRKSDDADIVKRNANRKKKYLLIFPGALSLHANGEKIGSLAALDTRNPVLNIKFPSGTLRLFGTLVFPQNAFISVKPAKRAVQVMDVFETMIVFSEWRWLGDLANNPGAVPVPLPSEMKLTGENLWKSDSVTPKKSEEFSGGKYVSSDGDSAIMVDTDEEVFPAAQDKGSELVPSRSNPRRKGRVVNYSQLEDDEGDHDSSELDSRETDMGADASHETKKRSRVRNGLQKAEETIEIEKEEEILPERPAPRKRRKVGTSAKSDQRAQNYEVASEHETGNMSELQMTAEKLKPDNSVEIVETTMAEDWKVKTRRPSRRTVRKIKYSQDSGDEYPVEDEEEDEDFHVKDQASADEWAVD